jgi:hypothetical protein
MIVIDDVLVSDEITEEYFHCNLSKCKGACCTEGDYGAPLSIAEMKILDEITPTVLSYLPKRSQQYLSNHKGYEYYSEPKVWATSCHGDGACVYLTEPIDGISMCGIEKAHADQKVEFLKPISCHLYPIRVSTNDVAGWEAWNYDQWDICSAACTLGAEMRIPIYKFLKSAIIRAKGEEFFNQLDEYYHANR